MAFKLVGNELEAKESSRVEETSVVETPKLPLVDIYEKIIQTNDKIVLNLIGCGLREFPDESLQMRNIDGLFLSNNVLTEIPDDISKLQNLEILVLQGNKLQQLTEAIGYTIVTMLYLIVPYIYRHDNFYLVY